MKNCPQRAKSNKKSIDWCSDELHVMTNKVYKLYNRAITTGTGDEFKYRFTTYNISTADKILVTITSNHS